MMDRAEVLRWLHTLDPSSSIAIDEGGLCLIEIDEDGDETTAYLEIGIGPTEECKMGIHSWIHETGLLPPDTKCDHCSELYGNPG
jgi:hypothetical protein